MYRRFLAAAFAAVLLLAGSSVPQPARAVVPVFDPANFAKFVALLVKEDYITQQNAAKLVYDYQIATEAYNNGHLNYDMVYQQVVPMLNNIDKEMGKDKFMQSLVQRMMQKFQAGYPGWSPTIDYNDILGSLNNSMQSEMGQIVTNARQNQQEVSTRSKQMDTLTAQLARSKGAVDSLATVGEEIQVLQGTQAQVHTQLVNMLQDMNTYFAYQMQKDQTQAQDVGNKMLLQQFGKIPGQATPPAPASQQQQTPTLIGTPHP